MVLSIKKKCPLVFIQGIFRGSKRALTEDQVNNMSFPAFKETSVSALWEIVDTNSIVRSYLPDNWSIPEKVDRAFLIKVLCTLFPEFMVALETDVRAQRASLKAQRVVREDLCQISDEWLGILNATPWKASKSTSALPH